MPQRAQGADLMIKTTQGRNEFKLVRCLQQSPHLFPVGYTLFQVNLKGSSQFLKTQSQEFPKPSAIKEIKNFKAKYCTKSNGCK